MAKLWGKNIIAKNKNYEQVPPGLRRAVAAYLVSVGHGELVTE